MWHTQRQHSWAFTFYYIYKRLSAGFGSPFCNFFANDTSVTIEGDNESMLIDTLNIELEKLNIWLQANKLTINVSKSHYMIFHRRRRKIDINNPSLNNTVLQRVNYTKFLDVIIDDGLKWTNHITYDCKEQSR